MPKDRNLGSMEKVGFGTSVSFDIDDAPAPTRRRISRRKKEKQEIDAASACPGCGNEINQSEWLDALIGFISGAHDFAVGNPVRARIVQTLKNEVARMPLPTPHDDWELEVVGRLLKEIERIVTAEVRRIKMDDKDENLSIIRQEIYNEAEIALRPVLELEIRQEVEQQLWQEFETAWKERGTHESE